MFKLITGKGNGDYKDWFRLHSPVGPVDGSYFLNISLFDKWGKKLEF